MPLQQRATHVIRARCFDACRHDTASAYASCYAFSLLMLCRQFFVADAMFRCHYADAAGFLRYYLLA